MVNVLYQLPRPSLLCYWWAVDRPFQHGGCDGTPRYGTRDGPLSFCQAHKRVGLYTIRDGELYVATRDGSGESSRCPRALESYAAICATHKVVLFEW